MLFDFFVGCFHFGGLPQVCNSHPVPSWASRLPSAFSLGWSGWVEVMKLGYTQRLRKIWETYDLRITKNISSKWSSWSFWYMLTIPLIFGYIYIYIMIHIHIYMLYWIYVIRLKVMMIQYNPSNLGRTPSFSDNILSMQPTRMFSSMTCAYQQWFSRQIIDSLPNQSSYDCKTLGWFLTYNNLYITLISGVYDTMSPQLMGL